MDIIIDDKKYDIEIIRKNNKRTYLRVKEPNLIVVTTGIFVTNKTIIAIINDNIESLKKMIQRFEKKNKNNSLFFYLGNQFDVIYWNSDVEYQNNRLFINKDDDIDKWYRKQANIVFKQELDRMYNLFCYDIPYPRLTIRKMTSRWGVCNTKDKRVTLNLELIKKDIKYLDYVIVHELSHLIHQNHSKNFWKCVEENCKEYKILRKELNDE